MTEKGTALEDAARVLISSVRLFTYRGQDAVVVIAVEELKKLLPGEQPQQSLVEFLRDTALGEIDIRREPDRGRDLVL